MTAAEAARQLGISRQRLYQWLPRGPSSRTFEAGQIIGCQIRGATRTLSVRASLRLRTSDHDPAVRKGRGRTLNRRLVARLRAQGASWRTIAKKARLLHSGGAPRCAGSL